MVDGRRVDDTISVARALRSDVRIVLQNRVGKGNAMACGFAAATGDIIVMLDADGSADPREIPRFVAALVEGADFAKGTRFANGGGSADITRVRAWGNRWLNRIANLLFGLAVIALAVWVSRRYAERMARSPLVRRLMRDLAGSNLNAAEGFLERVARFEEERTA